MLIRDLGIHLQYVMTAHRDYSKDPKDRVRHWDGKTPYAVHPIWCGMTILTETSLPQNIRTDGCLALLYHDILEDTTAELPSNLPETACNLVKEMTFLDGSAQEMREIWEKSDMTKLLKVYDKVSNLLDGTRLSPEKRLEYRQYTGRLTAEVKNKFGELNITRIAEGILVC